jgi:HAUS augmin-like complex subunit 1
MPNFERNEDTLRTLLALAAANDAADEEATVLHHAREHAIQGFKAREEAEEKQKKEILDELELCLDDTGGQSLDELAESAAALGALSTKTEHLGQLIVELAKEEFSVQEQIAKVDMLHDYLQRELAALREQLGELKSNQAYEVPTNLPAMTAEWTRGTKMLTAKVNEYHDKVSALERNRSKGPTLEELVADEEDVTKLMGTVKRLEHRLKLFHDLPKDIQGARAKYRELERELDELTRQRNSKFERLVPQD